MMARRSVSRAHSSSSTLSCITCVMTSDESQTASRNGSSSTPSTSNTDAASTTSSTARNSKDGIFANGSVRRVTRSAGIYNEHVTTSSTATLFPTLNPNRGYRTVPGETIVGERAMHAQLLQDSIQLPDMDWVVNSMSGDEMIGSAGPLRHLERNKSARLSILKTTSNVIVRTKSILGKRGQDGIGAGRDKLQHTSRTASLRPRIKADFCSKGPPEMKLIVPGSRGTKQEAKQDSNLLNLTQKSLARPRVKRWLSHGLYVGQERDFDARLSESKNKLKRASTGSRAVQQRSILPMPMFAGQRSLEMGRDFRLPFDVFSPLPPGQPKPEEWRKTQKNVFVGDAAEFWKTSKRLEHSTCICEPSSHCDEDCFNRFMFYECDESNCNIGVEHCTNRSFEHLRQRCKAGGKYNVGVEVIKTADRGYGVRSNRTFEPNQIIVEYTGEIITQDECDNRMRNMYRDNECFYLMVFDQNMIIDATRGSIARFVNHSCEPNCRMVKWTVVGKPRMALFAGDKGILTGEELTYDYNFDPFSSKNIQQCRCGAPSCRGVLGPRPKDTLSNKPKEIKDALAPIVNIGTKRKLQQAYEDTSGFIASKKRQMTLPKTMKTTFEPVRQRATNYLAEAEVLSASETKHMKLVKKMPERSLRGLRPAQAPGKNNRQIRRQGLATHQKRRSSSGTFIKASMDAEQPLGRNKAVTAAAGNRWTVGRTSKGSHRTGGGGNSIRIIGDTEVRRRVEQPP